MAAREINIPFGPDKTGGLGLTPLDDTAPEETPVDPFAEPPVETYAATSQREGSVSNRFARRPSSAADGAEAAIASTEAQPSALPSSDGERVGRTRRRQAASDEADAEYHAGGMTEDEATAQGYDEMQMSFIALKDSVGQGRQLKAREKEQQEFEEKLDIDREELEDRENILQNYQSLASEQDAIIAQCIEQRESLKAELAQVVAKLDETTEALGRMREYHTTEMQPLETELGRARANADQAKNDERSRKSELSAAESELRRANSTGDSAMAAAKHEQVQTAYEKAKIRSEQAKDTLDEVQRIYDEALQQIDQAESPLERSIEDLKGREAELKETIGSLGEDISAAKKRRQYCDTVYQYPDETAKLRAAVAADESKLATMVSENDELRDLLAQSKQQAKKAKLALGIVAVIVVVFIIALIVIISRS